MEPRAPQWELNERFLRITDLLGDHRSIVEREAAVYALSALADDCAELNDGDLDESYRLQQACLNLICSQLRDPITGSTPASELLVFKHRVQNLIVDRFRPRFLGGIADWSHLWLDLTYCHLHDFGLSLATLSKPVNFAHAHFHGNTSFNDSQFHAPVLFTHAHFTGLTSLQRVQFHHTARFTEAEFTALAVFNESQFDRDAFFDEVCFTGSSWFRAVTFDADADFTSAQFWDTAHFQDSDFASYATFSQAQFTSTARIEKCTFRDGVDLCEVFFGGPISFNKSEFIDSVCFDDAFFTTSPLFRSAMFNEVQFHRTHFHCPVMFGPFQFSTTTDFSDAVFCSGFGLHADQGTNMELTLDGTCFSHDEDTVIKELDNAIPSGLLKTAMFEYSCDSPLQIRGR